MIQEESFTSGTSFIDDEEPTKDNYNKARRKYRGAFVSNQGLIINADINSAYQIIKKRTPQATYTRAKGMISTIPTKITINKQCIGV